ncbi:hypothetical protein CFAM422_007117 [Trichoderma lentiforme]|uniref:Uncharacterized protein n=1 Tax=Trichoderma lentiforme TaxID=1567552 RepID=A0A9P4XDR8_9HYPO|nr:hypothetical protein CFAM422_007117 [Trichoderma lentiforme]
MSRCSRASWEAWSGCAGGFEKLAEEAWDGIRLWEGRIDLRFSVDKRRASGLADGVSTIEA